MLPSLIVIGAMKAGTSSLHAYLDQHSEISMSNEKELDFFVAEKNWRLGLKWYLDKLPQNTVVGESSPNYSKWPSFSGVPQRIRECVPGVKLIYVLRDPIDRLISHYVHNLSSGDETRDLESLLCSEDSAHYLATSCYWLQLSKYLEYFPKEQIFLVQFERLIKQPHIEMKEIFKFLGVQDFECEVFGQHFHSSKEKMRPTRLGLSIGRSFAGRAGRRLFRPAFERPITKPKLSQASGLLLVEKLSNDVQQIREYTGWNLERWKTWNRHSKADFKTINTHSTQVEV